MLARARGGVASVDARWFRRGTGMQKAKEEAIEVEGG